MTIDIIRGLAIPVVPIASLLALSRYGAPSFITRVERPSIVAWMTIGGGLFVCGAMHLALLGLAAGLLTGVMPDSAARVEAAWIALLASGGLVAVFFLTNSCGCGLARRDKLANTEATRQTAKRMSKELRNTWPVLLAVQYAYMVAALLLVDYTAGTEWLREPWLSGTVLVAVAVAFGVALFGARLVADRLATWADWRMRGSPEHRGITTIQPYFTVKGLTDDFFAAWPIAGSGLLALHLAIWADTTQLRRRDEWTRMLPYLQFAPMCGLYIAAVWQYRQPAVELDPT
jgi:hypothetical protein